MPGSTSSPPSSYNKQTHGHIKSLPNIVTKDFQLHEGFQKHGQKL
jgi:hypothetical protein